MHEKLECKNAKMWEKSILIFLFQRFVWKLTNPNNFDRILGGW